MNSTYLQPIWYPLFTAFLLFIALRIAYKCFCDWWEEDALEKWMVFVLYLLGIGVGWIALMGAATGLDFIISSHAAQSPHECWRGKMVSMRSSDGVAGSLAGGIFLMSGQIGSEQFYHYYTAYPDRPDIFYPHKWKANQNTRVFEEERKDGDVVQYCQHFTNDWVSWFATPSREVGTDFHIPRGSLKQTFSLQ